MSCMFMTCSCRVCACACVGTPLASVVYSDTVCLCFDLLTVTTASQLQRTRSLSVALKLMNWFSVLSHSLLTLYYSPPSVSTRSQPTVESSAVQPGHPSGLEQIVLLYVHYQLFNLTLIYLIRHLISWYIYCQKIMKMVYKQFLQHFFTVLVLSVQLSKPKKLSIKGRHGFDFESKTDQNECSV